MKVHLKKVLSYILAMAMILAMLPMPYALAAGEPGITLGSATFSGGKFYYGNATVTGDNIRTILISFSGNVTTGDEIVLPTAPGGFSVSASSAGNDYTKRINLIDGIAASDVQDFIRGVGFTIAGQAQTVQVTVTTEDIAQDTFYYAGTGHYYQFVPNTTSTWIQAYDAAKAKAYMGRTGYLATVSSLGEDTFVNSLSGKTGWLGGTILTNTGTSAGSLYYNGFNTNSVVSTGWYWACGPEKGSIFYNINSLDPNQNDATFTNQKDNLNSTYFNWTRGLSNEPNNKTASALYFDGAYETCLSTLKISGRTGKHGTVFTWNDLRYNSVGTDQWYANGYFVEYGDQPMGDSGSASGTFAIAGGTLGTTYTATVNTYVDGALAAAPGSVELRQGGVAVYSLGSGSAGVYTESAVNGTYDVYINSEDTGEDITISDDAGSAAVHYYSVSFSAENEGAASGSTVSATVGVTPIVSGAPVLAGKTITITATGAGASTYAYLWSGSGTSSETTAAITIPSLAGTVNALCTVTGVPATYAADVSIYTDGVLAAAPGSVVLKQAGATRYTLGAGGTTGIYTVQAVNGTYDVFVSGEDTGADITINNGNGSATVNYYTVGFSVANAGTASGSTISATAGGTPIFSGTAVLSGKAVTITAIGAGADSFTYLWSGEGSNGETSGTITIPALSATVNASCMVTGTTVQPTYAADIHTYTDDVLAQAAGAVELRQGGMTIYTATSSATGVYTASAINGTYDIYINNVDTNADITVSGTAVTAAVNYYTVSFSAQDAGAAWGSTVSATAGGTPIASGTAVLAGKVVTLTGHGAGASKYTYAWSGPGTNGEWGTSITIYPSGTVNVLCRATGMADLHQASIYTYADGALATVPGSVQLWRGGAAVFTADNSVSGVYTMGAAYGTYDIYINNEDTGVDFAFDSSVDSSSVYYYTVSFAAANTGTASGSTISATAGGTPIASGAAVLPGKAVTITASGAGADSYTYLWAGSGTSGETSAAITIQALDATINAMCTVTGTTAPVTGEAKVYTYQDGVPAAAPGSVELRHGGAAVYTLASGATGVYSAFAAYGTYDIYINNGDTGEDLTVSADSGTSEVYYYTVSFAVANAGTASGSVISATTGGTGISSGTALLAGKQVIITAAGAGADTYAYLWSGSGASGETAGSITLPALSDTVNVLCTVTGTTGQHTYSADINTYSDGVLAAAPGAVELRQNGVTIYTAGSVSMGLYSASCANGSYDIFINNEDTGENIIIGGAANSAEVDYYTVSFAVANTGTASGSTILATAGGTPLSSGTSVLAGKGITITAVGTGADTYTYFWAGAGTGGETNAAITIPALGGTVNALCTVTGAAKTFTPGTLEEKSDNTTIIAEGLFTQDARLYIIPLAEGEEDRKELESLLSGKQTAAAFEVHIEPADAFKAPLTLSFQVGQQYNGRNVYILHRLHSGSVEQFTVTVANGEAVITVQELSPFLLTVDPPVNFTVKPQNVTVVTGQTATFSVTATGTEPLAYQWQKRTGTNASWEDISGATSPEHTTSQANVSNSGFQYRVIVTDAYGRSITSDAATLTVTKAPEPPATGDHSQPALYMALIVVFMLSTLLLLHKRKKA